MNKCKRYLIPIFFLCLAGCATGYDKNKTTNSLLDYYIMAPSTFSTFNEGNKREALKLLNLISYSRISTENDQYGNLREGDLSRIQNAFNENYKDVNFEKCDGIADATVHINELTKEISVRVFVRKGSELTESAILPGKTLIRTDHPKLAGERKLTMCLRNKFFIPNPGTKIAMPLLTISDDDWGKTDQQKIVTQEIVHSRVVYEVLEAWNKDYENKMKTFISAVRNGTILDQDAVEFLYTYRGFATGKGRIDSNQLKETEELIFDCLTYGKIKIAKMLADQIVKHGYILNPILKKELDSRR